MTAGKDDGGLLVLTNDDGIDAPGLAALFEATAGLGRRLVVAPSGPYSSCGHTITTDRPLAVRRRGDGWIAVDGSPADCVRVALHHLAPEAWWIVSGINRGANLGTDVHHSGTVAAAREAVLHGRPAVAVSQYLIRDCPVDWSRAAVWTARVLDVLLARPPGPRAFWNVNLPCLGPGAPEPPLVECPLDPSPLPLDFRIEQEGGLVHYAGDYHRRRRVAGGDVDVCFLGRTAVSRLVLP